MTQSDWIGWGASIALHVALIAFLAYVQADKPAARKLGFVEVELGEFAQGRPVQAVDREAAAAESEPQPEPKPEPQPEEPATTEPDQPVDLPDQTEEPQDQEELPPPDEETVPPESKEESDDTGADEQVGEQDEGSATGEPGEGASEEKSAPYDIEGLDRNAVRAPIPRYTAQVNATIRVRITVGPNGNIIRRIPLRKGNPKLEEAVMEALQRWQFNALPPGAPQENQTGIITFTFRLE
jgi:protein TonB